MIKILFTAFYVDENILNFNEDSGNVVLTCIWMSILNIDLNDISLDDTNYDEDNPDAIIPVRLFAWHIWIFLSDFKIFKLIQHKKLCMKTWHSSKSL